MSLLGPLPKGSACKALTFISRVSKRDGPKVRITRQSEALAALFIQSHFEELPTGGAKPSVMHACGGPGAFHAVQTVVFRRTGHP